MLKSENSVIPCSAEIDLTKIPTVGNVTEINSNSETRKFHRNFMEILMEMLNKNGTGNKYKISGISGITRNNPEISKNKGKFRSKPRKFWSKYVNYVNPYK